MADVEVDISKDVYLECYHHILDDSTGDIDIEILYGGRDSGKSQFIAQKLLEESMSADYFRCILTKETHDSIKDAQWQMLKDVATEWEVDSLFDFLTSPLSVRCINGNQFATRGLNNPGRIRSFTNPSHVWGEEANQFTEAGFITLLTSLRSKGNVKMYLSLNPESTVPDFQEFWLYKWFFAEHEPKKSFTGEKVIKIKVKGVEKEIRLKYRCTHTTYHDNPFVSDQRIGFHESLEATSPYWYKVFTLGEWGNIENDSPWAFAFSRKKHVGSVTVDRRQYLYLSWDFNRNPMCCSVIQFYDNHIHVVETIKQPKSGVDAMCEYIKVNYPGFLYIVTGDYSGMSESSLFKEQITHYKLIKHYLKLADGQLKVEPNPRLDKNSTHVNTILAYHKVTIDAQKARALIFDMENVKRRADGTILKEDRDDPTQQSDALDTFRYFCNIFLKKFKPAV
jgi:PBSX family phage terminase large subunit